MTGRTEENKVEASAHVQRPTTPKDLYTPAAVKACEKALRTILARIGPWGEKIVLVGGLVPSYLVPEIPEGFEPHLGTTDLDVLVGISLDQAGPGVVRPFVDKNQIPYPIVMGDQQTANAYGGVRSIPTAFLIDRQGRIVKKYVGYKPLEIFVAVAIHDIPLP